MFLIFRVQLPQGFAELDGKQDGGAGHGDGIRHRLGGVDCHGLICQQPGHQIDQGQQQDELPQHCHNDGAAGGANGNEGHLTGDLDTKEEQRPAIDPQGRRMPHRMAVPIPAASPLRAITDTHKYTKTAPQASVCGA